MTMKYSIKDCIILGMKVEKSSIGLKTYVMFAISIRSVYPCDARVEALKRKYSMIGS